MHSIIKHNSNPKYIKIFTYHHITGSNDISTGTSLGDGLLTELVDGNIVEDLSVLNDTIVSLVRVGVERNVGADNTVGVLLLDHADGTVDDSVGVVGLHAEVGLKLIGNLGEENKGLDAKVVSLADLTDHGIKRMTLASRHGGDFGVEVLIVDEEGVDEVGRA